MKIATSAEVMCKLWLFGYVTLSEINRAEELRC